MRSAPGIPCAMLVLAGVIPVTAGCSRIEGKQVAYQDESRAGRADADQAQATAREEQPGEPEVRDAGHVASGAPGEGAEPAEGELRRQAIALLTPILGDALAELTLDNFEPAAPLDGVNIAGHYGEVRNAERQRWTRPLKARIDFEHQYVCHVYSIDPPLSPVHLPGDRSATEAAEAFAKRHFVEWSDQTQLVTESHRASGLHGFRWANVLPSGAWTGAWCGILARAPGGIRSFVQQKAIRTVNESDVATTAEQASAVALKHVSANLRAGGTTAIRERRLVLSHPVAPNHGPLWELTVNVGSAAEGGTTAVEEVLVDGITGKVLLREQN